MFITKYTKNKHQTFIPSKPRKIGYCIYFFLIPFEKTVIVPTLLRPALFSNGFLKNFTILVNFTKNVDFLNLLDGVRALCCIVKILFNKI